MARMSSQRERSFRAKSSWAPRHPQGSALAIESECNLFATSNGKFSLSANQPRPPADGRRTAESSALVLRIESLYPIASAPFGQATSRARRRSPCLKAPHRRVALSARQVDRSTAARPQVPSEPRPERDLAAAQITAPAARSPASPTSSCADGSAAPSRGSCARSDP